MPLPYMNFSPANKKAVISKHREKMVLVSGFSIVSYQEKIVLELLVRYRWPRIEARNVLTKATAWFVTFLL